MLFNHELAWTNNKIYEEIYKNSVEYPDEFWKYHAKDIYWKEKPKVIFDGEKWLSGGISNACYNCVDRHAMKNPSKPAIIWYGDEEGERREVSYQELLNKVINIASILRSKGIGKSDVVGIYMPMVPEAIATMLACSRIGALHLVVFAGFSPEALAYRLSESKAKAIVTITSSRRGGKEIKLLQNVKTAISKINAKIDLINIDDKFDNLKINDEIEWQDSNDNLFILYTSGSTGNPKGVVHSVLPYLLYTSATFKIIFGIKEDDIYFCTSDVGWITGHSYIAYAPLFHGLTSVIFSGSPTYPEADRYWEIIEKEKVTVFYTAPTAIRSLKMFNKELVKRHDLSSLRVLGSVGEPMNKSAWDWFFETVGSRRCPIMDTWWQTETGGIILAPLRGPQQKPGVAGKPFFGIDTDIIDGELVIKNKWPGMCRAILENENFKTGDGASYDNDHDIKISGRLDDVINISGHRLGTAEFECAINKVEEVKESAVVAIKDEIKGQGAFAYVVLNEGEPPTDEIVKKIVRSTREAIGGIAKPDFIKFVPDLPKTRSGKIMRSLLKDFANGWAIDIPESVFNPEVLAAIKTGTLVHCPDISKVSEK